MNTEKNKINYVIATYSGIDKDISNSGHGRDHLLSRKPHPENYLKIHIENISKYKNNLSQITIMAPIVKNNNKHINYYDIKNFELAIKCPITIIECENFGCSYGQWLKSYEIFNKNFDFYIFVEDDYCPYKDNFDQILVNELIKKNCDYLSTTAFSKDNIPFHAAISNGIVKSLALEKIYNHYENPRSLLYKLYSADGRKLGEFCQVSFSLLFTNIELKIDDFRDNFSSLYYDSENDSILNLSTIKNEHIFIPLQFIIK